MENNSIASNLPRTMSLAELSEGDTGTLVQIGIDGADYIRVLRLGITPGRKVTLIRRGKSYLLSISGSMFALDRQLASALFVEQE